MGVQIRPIGRSDTTLADLAYQRISEAMLSGMLEPGSRLVMDQLAEQLDISRTPVRDALARLEREGMVEPNGRRGFMVRTLSLADTLNIYEAREAIEGFAARRVAELEGPAIDKVRTAVHATADIDMSDARATYEANMTIHRVVVEASGNPALVDMFDMLWHRARSFVAFANYMARDSSGETVEDAHLGLVYALEDGPDSAFEAMRDHIRLGRDTHLK